MTGGDDWRAKGCATCRAQWQAGRHPRLLAESPALHARLYRCDACGTLWEEQERFADTIGEAAARARYPDAAIA